MKREELNEIFKDVDPKIKMMLETMFSDFLYEVDQLEKIKPAIEKIGMPRNEMEAKKKRYLVKEYSDISQRHDNKIKIFLSMLQKSDAGEESQLVKMLKEFG